MTDKQAMAALIAISDSFKAAQKNDHSLNFDIELEALKIATRKLCDGEWIGVEYDGFADGCPVYETWECSACGHEHYGLSCTLTRYCPDCGARMEDING